ncbi:MAG: hypothetical protein QOH76_1812 [Thermoleophilaceae bacterium]|jgi:hypothetical protein|nr:hypothetical protein [Thermoleophilaceae bacterium]
MLEVWQIVLLVWIVVIPASVAFLTALAARRRKARARAYDEEAGDQLGQLLVFAPRTQMEHLRTARGGR